MKYLKNKQFKSIIIYLKNNKIRSLYDFYHDEQPRNITVESAIPKNKKQKRDKKKNLIAILNSQLWHRNVLLFSLSPHKFPILTLFYRTPFNRRLITFLQHQAYLWLVEPLWCWSGYGLRGLCWIPMNYVREGAHVDHVSIAHGCC